MALVASTLEYAGNLNRGVVHDMPSSMLEHLGHGAIVEVTQTTARCGDDDVIIELPAPGRTGARVRERG